MTVQSKFDVSADGPMLYERHKVPQMFAPMAEIFLGHVGLRSGDRVLDVACGTGIVARMAAPRVAPSPCIAGVDSHQGMLEVARGCSAEAKLAIEWLHGDASALPFPDESFDAVLCQQGLQFFPDPLRALNEMRRVLAPDGVLGLCVYGAPSRYNRALSEGLAQYAGADGAARALIPWGLSDENVLLALVAGAGFNDLALKRGSIVRRVVPSQEWVLQDTGGTPAGAAVSGLSAEARAAMLRDIAAKLKGLWDTDAFAVPNDLNVVLARK